MFFNFIELNPLLEINKNIYLGSISLHTIDSIYNKKLNILVYKVNTKFNNIFYL